MKTILKLLLLAAFAIVVFVPRSTMGSSLYWSLFVFMFLILLAYYRIAYWVRVADVKAVTDEPIRFSLYCAKIPPIATDDLVRGRLVVTDVRLALYQRDQKRGVREAWTASLDDIERVSIEKARLAKRTLILSLSGGKEAKFTFSAIKRMQKPLLKALRVL